MLISRGLNPKHGSRDVGFEKWGINLLGTGAHVSIMPLRSLPVTAGVIYIDILYINAFFKANCEMYTMWAFNNFNYVERSSPC